MRVQGEPLSTSEIDIYTLPHTKNEVWTYNPFMRFALSNNERIEPTKGAKGVCPFSGSELFTRYGNICSIGIRDYPQDFKRLKYLLCF